MARSQATTVEAYLSLHLHVVYASDDVAQRLRDSYDEAGMKLDMGKSCVRFKRMEQLHAVAVADATTAIGVDDYVALYEASRPG